MKTIRFNIEATNKERCINQTVEATTAADALTIFMLKEKINWPEWDLTILSVSEVNTETEASEL